MADPLPGKQEVACRGCGSIDTPEVIKAWWARIADHPGLRCDRCGRDLSDTTPARPPGARVVCGFCAAKLYADG